MLPGGKPEAGERDSECLLREVREELGATPRDELEPFGTFEADAANEPGRKVLARLYRLCLLSEPRPSGEIEEVVWYDFRKSVGHLTLAPLVLNFIVPQLRQSASI